MMQFPKSWEFHSNLTWIICHKDITEHIRISPMYTFSPLLVQTEITVIKNLNTQSQDRLVTQGTHYSNFLVSLVINSNSITLQQS
jgi:hypothetical protein